MSKLENRAIILAILTFFLFMLLIVWIVCAIQVDFNGIMYRAELSTAADLGVNIGDSADAEYHTRIAMQGSDFWAMWLASRLPWYGRLIVTLSFFSVIYVSALALLKTLNKLIRISKKGNKKR